MARIKIKPVMLEFTADYAGKEAGYIGSFMPDLASAIVKSGKAKYLTDEKPDQVTETKLKTSKNKKK